MAVFLIAWKLTVHQLSQNLVISRNMLMSAITGEDINEIDVSSDPLELTTGDRIVLCSDGLDTLSSGKIIQYADWSESPKECADALMEAVEEANMPRQDNTTAVVVQVRDTAAAEAASVAPAAEDPLDSTAEIAIGDITDENEVSTVEEPVAPAAAPVQEPETFDEPKSKTGLIIGIAAAVVIIIGAGAFFAMSGGGKSAPETELVAEETEAVIEEAEITEAVEEVLQQ